MLKELGFEKVAKKPARIVGRSTKVEPGKDEFGWDTLTTAIKVPAEDVGGPKGQFRHYTGTSTDMNMSNATLQAQFKATYTPGDSISTKQYIRDWDSPKKTSRKKGFLGFFKKGEKSPTLVDVVSDKLALVGSQHPKTVAGAKKIQAVQDVPFVGSKLKSVAVEKLKEKHAPLIRDVFGEKVKDDTLKELSVKTLNKITIPTDKLRVLHTSDSTKFVNSGNIYPKALIDAEKRLKKKKK